MGPIHLSVQRHTLEFTFLARTSRNTLRTKPCWILRLRDESTGREGCGECGPIWGLSREDEATVTAELERLGALGNLSPDTDSSVASVQFALESAWRHLICGEVLFESAFARGEVGIPVNGLIWMGDPAFMKKQVAEKLDAGFRCLKFKIGANDFTSELELLADLRREHPEGGLEIRLDANGAFAPDRALEQLKQLSAFGIHSIEQPIAAGQADVMAELVAHSPIPIALDEELIGIDAAGERDRLLRTIRPHYLILKPSLLGGLRSCDDWIERAEQTDTAWWATSMLESNVGLNMIAQWVGSKRFTLPQGLGTGGLYRNNFPSTLKIRGEMLWLERGQV